jgi:hypothetical protein
MDALVIIERGSTSLVEELQLLIKVEDELQQQRMAMRKQIGAKLTEIRLAKKLSFREAGELIGCDPGLLNRIEKGKAWAYTVVEKAMSAYATISISEPSPTV